MTDKTRNSNLRAGAKKQKKPFRLDLFIVDHFLGVVSVMAFVLYMIFKNDVLIYVSSVGILLVFATVFSRIYFKLQQLLRSKLFPKKLPSGLDSVPDLPEEMVQVLNEVAHRQVDQQ